LHPGLAILIAVAGYVVAAFIFGGALTLIDIARSLNDSRPPTWGISISPRNERTRRGIVPSSVACAAVRASLA